MLEPMTMRQALNPMNHWDALGIRHFTIPDSILCKGFWVALVEAGFFFHLLSYGKFMVLAAILLHKDCGLKSLKAE